MKRTWEDRARLENKAKNKQNKFRSKKFIKDGGAKNNHINCVNKQFDIDELEEMFES